MATHSNDETQPMLTLEAYKIELAKHTVYKTWVSSAAVDAQVGKHYSCYVARMKGKSDQQILFKTNKRQYMLNGDVIAVGKPAKEEAEAALVDKQPKDIEDMEERIARKYLHLKESARKRDKDFNLTLADVRKLVTRKTCFYTGMKVGIYQDQSDPRNLTIDRVDATLGYVKGNVVTCSHLANQFKSKIEHDFVDFLPRDKMLKILEKMFK